MADIVTFYSKEEFYTWRGDQGEVRSSFDFSGGKPGYPLTISVDRKGDLVVTKRISEQGKN